MGLGVGEEEGREAGELHITADVRVRAYQGQSPGPRGQFLVGAYELAEDARIAEAEVGGVDVDRAMCRVRSQGIQHGAKSRGVAVVPLPRQDYGDGSAGQNLKTGCTGGTAYHASALPRQSGPPLIGQKVHDNCTVTPGTSDIEAAADVLRAGGLVAFPTETVYGLGANAEDPVAVERIFRVKGRPSSHPLIVHLGAEEQLGGWVEDVPASARALAQRFWPGPLTLVLRRGPRVPLEATGGLETVAVRVPDHPVALALLSAFAGGVTAPSANRFGSVSPTTADHVRAEFGDAVDFVLDGGPCTVGVESTIVDVTGPQPSILRPGGVTREELHAALGSPVAVPSTTQIRVPGQHPSHYAPRARVVLVHPTQVGAEAEAAAAMGYRVGVLVPARGGAMPVAAHAVVALPASLEVYARGLYGFLRELDQRGCDLIIASLPAEEGLGLAIANRLRRAAGPRA